MNIYSSDAQIPCEPFETNPGYCGSISNFTPKSRIKQASEYQNWITLKKPAYSNQNSAKSYTIPIVFHLFEDYPSITNERIYGTVSNLNQVFAHSGRYGIDTVGVNTRINFCLAQTAPDGGMTTGITRTTSAYTQFDKDLETQKLKTISQWDPRHYLNVWVVDRINSEASTKYTGRDGWARNEVGGFATLPFAVISGGNPHDGIVVSGLNEILLAHEAGHYLGLLHTFEQGCKNDNCLLDGDMVCDTPPDNSVENSCDSNSCKTDTLSNYSNNHYFEDVPDMGTNIMDYGNEGCSNNFSQGQAERMQFTLESYRPELFFDNEDNQVCSSICDNTYDLRVVQNIPLPTPDSVVHFTTNSVDSLTNYEWHVEFLGSNTADYSVAWITGDMEVGKVVGTTQDLTYKFPDTGKYGLYLRAWNKDNPECFASYYKVVRVICGVDARFTPDKRLIASKLPVSRFVDSVIFINRSSGALEYDWILRHTNFEEGGLNLPEVRSSSHHLIHYFHEPGIYDITLVASNGSCTDTTNTFYLSVLDPTIDGEPLIQNTSCYGQDSIRIELTIHNYGFDTINVNTPVSIYNDDPFDTSSMPELLGTYLLDKIVYGYDCRDFTFNIPGDLKEYEQLFAVFNDPGTTEFPLQFPQDDKNVLSANSIAPASDILELIYGNNQNRFSSGQDTLSLDKEDLWACDGQEIELNVDEHWQAVSWQSSNDGEIGQTNPVSYFVDGSDIITLQTASTQNCVYRDTFQISLSVPEVELQQPFYTIQKGESVVLMASGGINYEWYPDESLSDPFISSPRAFPEETTTYSVEVADSLGCIATASLIVYVEEPAFVPNLFTPNQDGRNDYLKVYGLKDIQHLRFKVFNRVGTLVFETSDHESISTTGWDGSWNGVQQPSGAYYWQVEGQHEYGKKLLLNGVQTGIIHLIR